MEAQAQATTHWSTHQLAMSSAPAPTLNEELLGRCLSWLTLTSLPGCGCASRHWTREVRNGFARQLSWKHANYSCQALQLGQADTGKESSGSQDAKVQIRRTSGHIKALGGGRFVILAVSHIHGGSVKTFIVDGNTGSKDEQCAVEQSSPRHRRCAMLCGSDVGGVVGHSDDGAIVFFPAVNCVAEPTAGKVFEVPSVYQNVLHCGEQVFLLHRCHMWDADDVMADVLHLEAGKWLEVNIGQLLQRLRELVGNDERELSAVSATRDHFIIHITTSTGAKVAGAVRLPNAASTGILCAERPPPPPQERRWTRTGLDRSKVEVSFARRWEPGNPIATMSQPHEMPAGDCLLLYAGWESEGLLVCLLDASTGQVESQVLRWPRHPEIVRNFLDHEELAHLSFVPQGKVACGCGFPLHDLGPPPVVLWDFETGLVLSECGYLASPLRTMPPPLSSSPSSAAQGRHNDPDVQRAPGALRFQVGSRVECRTNRGWQPGQVVAIHYSEPGWPPGETAPYQIRCADGSLLFAPQDVPQLIRRHVVEGMYASSYKVQAAACADTKQLLLALFHESAPASKLYLLRRLPLESSKQH